MEIRLGNNVLLILVILMMCGLTKQSNIFLTSSIDGRDAVCLIHDGLFIARPTVEQSVLDQCFNDDGSYNRRACSQRKVDRILSKWYKSVPKVYRGDMSAEEFRSTHGLGWEGLKRLRTLAMEIRRKLAELNGVNPPSDVEYPEVFDDRIMSEEELREWLDRLNASGIQKRIVLRSDSRLWPKEPGWPNSRVIYYLFDNSWEDAANMEKVRKGMKHWESLTCYKFVDVDADFPDDPLTSSFIRITRDGTGCEAHAGKRNSGGQDVILSEDRCLEPGAIMHELGHAIGVMHEHQRPDRSDFVDIHVDNIDPDFLFAFDQLSLNQVISFDVPYDHSSIWHYRVDHFSINAEPTITPKDPAFINNLGQQNFGPTFFDIKIVNKKGCLDPLVFETPRGTHELTCDAVLEGDGGECHNSGYVDFRTCTSCICPWGLRRPYCDKVAISSRGCTEAGEHEVPAGHAPVCVEVGPGFDLSGVQCSWLLKKKPPLTVGSPDIELWFEGFDTASCSDNFLEIRANDFGTRAPWYCDDQGPPLLKADQFLIHFRSRIGGEEPTGFKMCWKITSEHQLP